MIAAPLWVKQRATDRGNLRLTQSKSPPHRLGAFLVQWHPIESPYDGGLLSGTALLPTTNDRV